jgi:hypothetical protein
MRILPWIYGQVGSVHAAASMRGFRRAPGFGSSASPPTVTAGAGFSGATAVPPAQGSAGHFGYARNVIARWVVPHYCTAATTGDGLGETLQYVAVHADHMSGIQKISYSIDNGTWVDVTEPTVRNGQKGWWVRLDPAMADLAGREMRARIYPNDGTPIVMQGDPASAWNNGKCALILSSNFGGTLAKRIAYISPSGNDGTGVVGNRSLPFLTMQYAANALRSGGYATVDPGTNPTHDAGGCEIHCEIGAYTLNGANFGPGGINRYMTIKPAAGVTRAQVWITSTSADGISIKKLRVYNCSLGEDGVSSTRTFLANWTGANGWLLIDRCDIDNHDRTDVVDPAAIANGWARDSMIDSSVHDIWNVSYTVSGQFDVISGCTFTRIAEDVLRQPGYSGNITISDVDPGSDVSLHPDMFVIDSLSNIVAYNITATDTIVASQGLYGGPVTDFACEALTFARTGGSARTLSLVDTLSNLIIRNSSFSDQWQTDTFTNPHSPAVTYLLDGVTNSETPATKVFPQDSAEYAGAGSPAFPWTSTRGVRYET